MLESTLVLSANPAAIATATVATDSVAIASDAAVALIVVVAIVVAIIALCFCSASRSMVCCHALTLCAYASTRACSANKSAIHS